jgi:hypothetical protein
MPISELRFTGFKDANGLNIYEGDYLILKLSDLPADEIKQRTLNVMMDAYDIQYMQAYIKPTGQLRYDLDVIYVDGNNRALTEVEYAFIYEKHDMSKEDFWADFAMHSKLDAIETCPSFHYFSMLKGIVQTQLWVKSAPLINREHVLAMDLKLFDNKQNPIVQGQHFLFTVPDSVFHAEHDIFYGGNLGKHMKEISARHYLVYIIPTEFLSVRLMTCFLKDDMTPFSIAEDEAFFKHDAAYYEQDGIDINTVDQSDVCISYAEDAFTFVRYLISKGWLSYEPNPAVDMSKIKVGYKHFFSA